MAAPARAMADIKKFYEYVSHGQLWQGARATSFPLDLLRALVGLYAGARALMCGEAVSAPLLAGGTILAGCSCALLCTSLPPSAPWVIESIPTNESCIAA